MNDVRIARLRRKIDFYKTVGHPERAAELQAQLDELLHKSGHAKAPHASEGQSAAPKQRQRPPVHTTEPSPPMQAA